MRRAIPQLNAVEAEELLANVIDVCIVGGMQLRASPRIGEKNGQPNPNLMTSKPFRPMDGSCCNWRRSPSFVRREDSYKNFLVLIGYRPYIVCYDNAY